MRSGTTSLWKAFDSHPDVYVPDTKELHFFDDRDGRFTLGVDWYADHFRAGMDAIAGELSPSYLFVPGTAERIHRVLPHVRLIAILRDPVARAWSHYWFSVRTGRERLPFAEAIEREAERTNTADVESLAWFSYVSRGMYLEQLQRYEAVFPRDQLCVVLLEDLRKNPAETLDVVFRHLGTRRVAATVDSDGAHSNRGRFPRSRGLHLWALQAREAAEARPRPIRQGVHLVTGIANRLNRREHTPQLPDSTRRRLVELYRPANDALAEWLGRPLPWSQ
jgi:hypothetical protein